MEDSSEWPSAFGWISVDSYSVRGEPPCLHWKHRL